MSDEHGHAHHKYQAHHWDTMRQQFEAGKLGMWLFLATEVLLFGGLFCAYFVYRANYPELFSFGHHALDKAYGGVNTVVLLFSSLTMALAVRASQTGNRDQLLKMLAITFLCGCGFMGIKFVEYKAKIDHGYLLGEAFNYEKIIDHESHAHADEPTSNAEKDLEVFLGPDIPAFVPPEKSEFVDAASGPSGLVPEALTVQSHGGDHADGHHDKPGYLPAEGRPRNIHIYFSIYFMMTGLHGIHVLIGMAVIAWLFVVSLDGRFGPDYFTPVEVGGLYWHLVDLIWIFLFPLLYLV